MRLFILFAAFLTISISASPMALELRPAPEFKAVDPFGNPIVMSKLKGRVGVVTFFLTTCQHCQRFCQMLTNLAREFAPQGFRAVGFAAFGANSPAEVASFVKNFGVAFSVGASVTREEAAAYLGHSIMSPIIVPQVVVIDRKGFIRAVTPPEGESDLRTEATLRKLIQSLLAEGTGAPQKAAAKKASK